MCDTRYVWCLNKNRDLIKVHQLDDCESWKRSDKAPDIFTDEDVDLSD